MPNQKPKIYTVSQINSLIKVALEQNLPSRLTVRGEISDWKHHSSGHCYFSLKDEGSVLPCVMWASSFKKVKFQPENGMEILSTGYIDTYPPQGKYQFYIESMQPAGVGALQLAFEQMVRRLAAEGLFDERHKKPLPKYPMRIGILTSESGAALSDIKDSILNRWPCTKLFFYPVPVQGEGAAAKIAMALREVNKRNKQFGLDIVIVGRGGGSLEDLWAFNEEVLARAIFDSALPVISAVGHEIDTTIADLVADARASTPTKAGVIAVPDVREVTEQLISIQRRLTGNVTSLFEISRHRLQTVLAREVFRNPLLPVRNCEQRIDDLQTQMAASLKELVVQIRNRLYEINEQVKKLEPHRLLAAKNLDLTNLSNRANSAMTGLLNKCRLELTARSNRLKPLNPKSVLKRGYSITTNKTTGWLIRTPEDIQIGDFITTELAGENLIESKVTKK